MVALTRPHSRLRKVWFNIGVSDRIRAAVGVGLDMVTAAMIAAVDQHFAEGDLLLGRHGRRF
jgi:hypothetical protein